MVIELRVSMVSTIIAALVVATAGTAQTRDDSFTPQNNAVVSTGNCTGSLISHHVVLTAAHCLSPEHRADRPTDARDAECSGLQQQAKLQGPVWEDPSIWYPAKTGLQVWVGNSRTRMHLSRNVTHYAMARCADMVLLRIEIAFPLHIARAYPIMTRPPEDPDRMLTLSDLRYSGWGSPDDGSAPPDRRQTGRSTYWGHNRCFALAMPPSRSEETRVLKGDSGSPLLWRYGEQEIVLGVLWGTGNMDRKSCGASVPPAPQGTASYTPTWRGAIGGSDATDIGAWLRDMVPDAKHIEPPQ